MKEVPFYKNRFIKDNTNTKFQDDCYLKRIKYLQSQRKSNHISYDPGTGCYTDANTEDLRIRKCVEIKYQFKNKNKYIENILQRKKLKP